MLADYLHWQYFWAPRWLWQLIVNFQLAVLRLFSVSFMLRTMFTHWHRDIARYRGGTLSSYTMTFAWNQVSRLIGFIIRLSVLLCWLAVEICFLSISLIVFVFFILWPVLIVFGFLLGIALLIT